MEGAVAATPVLKKAADPQQYPHTPEDLRKEPNYPIWVRLRAGDRGARDELVVKYAPLVKYVIGRMAISLPAAMDSDDVLSAGTVGLLHAIDRFDPDQGVRFETYALQRIRGSSDARTIDDEIAEMERRILPNSDPLPLVEIIADLRRADDLIRSKKDEDQERGNRLLKDTLRRLR